MALTLFSRRRPAPIEPLAADPERWPDTGETWTPEGVTIVQRYYNQSGAVVIVYTASQGYQHCVSCLGCHFTPARNKHSSHSWLELAEAAEAANSHATTCRALPRDIPARPDDGTAREYLRRWVNTSRNRVEDQEFWIESLGLHRLTLQRNDAWIEAALQQLAVEQPDILRTDRSEYSEHFRYYARRYRN